MSFSFMAPSQMGHGWSAVIKDIRDNTTAAPLHGERAHKSTRPQDRAPSQHPVDVSAPNSPAVSINALSTRVASGWRSPGGSGA
jgi:hypothetical protein